MYRKFLFIVALPMAIISCSKSDKSCGLTLSTDTAPASEVADVQAYLTSKSITADQHPSGLFYKIHQPGSGDVPGACSVVTVKYKGSLSNGTGFDSSYKTSPNGYPFTLGDRLIAGWQLGVPLIKKGGSITLYIPPSLGYKAAGSGPIPPNSILIFNIDLVDVQ
ncbi:MAG: FKBP-type peptidyl-prolyl cis-trans isomerase [Ferruginibacter sp.]